MKNILVKKGESVCSNQRDVQLKAHSLGSALAIIVTDPTTPVTGMAVCILPHNGPGLPGIFEQIRGLFRCVTDKGAKPEELQIILCGAAAYAWEPKELALGARLYKMARKALDKNGFKVKSEHVGGPLNRSVVIRVGAATATVTVFDQKEIEI